MRNLLGSNWMKNTVPQREANGFDPELGHCCHLARFRVHLEGTTCDAWNRSATNVFVDGFLQAHPDYDATKEPVRDMVRMKAQATLDSMIRQYRKLNTRTMEELAEERAHKARQERKRKVNPAHSASPSMFTGLVAFQSTLGSHVVVSVS